MSNILKYIPSAINKLHRNILPIKGKGSYIYTKENVKYLDFTSGIGALSTGHSHPYIINKVKKQIDNIVHAPQQVFQSHVPQIEFTQKLLNIMPCESLNNVFYVSSGSEATDNAIKIARKYTQKTNIIALNRGFHGRTLGALSVTSSNLNCKLHSQPLIPGIYFCETFTEKSINNILEYQSSPDDTAAVIVESVQGEGGINSVPSTFLQYVKNICEQNNILFIADEVQCGSGRTGTWWNIEQKNVDPDIMTFGKGIASGFPIAGVVANENIMNNLGKGYLGGTYGGNALVSCAAEATIDVIKNEKLLLNTKVYGNILNTELSLIPEIKEIRQYGLMIAFDFYNHKSIEIVNKLRENNVLVLLAGNKNQYIRILPALNISREEVHNFINALKLTLN